MNRDRNYLILMAEDDADDRLLVQDAFAECGATDAVRFVTDGEELVDYLLRRGRYEPEGESPRPDLILLDLNMPRKDGREALKEIRAHAALRGVPVVVFTTSRAHTDITRVYDLGANSFVTKPAEFDELVSTISQLTGYWFRTVELPSTSCV
ncbi:MAG: response regulator [Verrucomicrobiae bacterium]|nr:response regulator [Verrucomicrobiae bacterium]